jgi:hypothetical protein
MDPLMRLLLAKLFLLFAIVYAIATPFIWYIAATKGMPTGKEWVPIIFPLGIVWSLFFALALQRRWL